MLSVEQLAEILDLFFPPAYSARNALFLIGSLGAMLPLLALLHNQQRLARRQTQTGWDTTIATTLELLASETLPEEMDGIVGSQERIVHKLIKDFSPLVDLTELEMAPLLATIPQLLCTPHVNCTVCDDHPALRRRMDAHLVPLIGADTMRTHGLLVSAVCKNCKTIYWPDRISVRPDPASQTRRTRLEPDPQYIRISKTDQLWVHRDIAKMQESAFRNLHCGWSSFAQYLSEWRPGSGTGITYRQARRMFAEHFTRRLLRAHDAFDAFTCPGEYTADDLMASVVTSLGSFIEGVGEDARPNGGMAPGAFQHSCGNCTHPKQYRTQIVAPGDGEQLVVGVDDVNIPHDAPAPEVLAAQAAPAENEELYVTMAVMDGKAIQHATCAIADCNRPLTNYKDGRFCSVHEEAGWNDRCGIIPCGRPRATALGRKFYACDLPEHKAFFESYQRRFGRMTFSGVQRVIRQQVRAADEGAPGLQLRPHLPDVNGLAGNRVQHVFRPRAVYCIQTIQWACGYPIAWTKFYDSESVGNVFQFIDKVWVDHPLLRPCFIAYDKACALLAHLQTSHPDSTWIEVTRFIVDTWHYIGHRADDILCRTFCNPAPADGSQPDLVIERRDSSGRVHRARAFNLETAEQFNSWLDRYKYLLEQMTATAHDFMMHSLFLLYTEIVDARIAKRAARDAAQAAQDEEDDLTDGDDAEMDEPDDGA